jgi:ribose transport system substrate-binding protein
MKKIKSITIFSMAVLLVFVFLIGLSGCGKGSGGNNSGDGYIIGFSNFGVGNSWRIQMEAEFKAGADKLKSSGSIKEYYMMDSNGDVAKQIADMKELIAKKCDAIIITAASPDELSPVCEEAMEAGIVIISFDNYVTTDKITAKVGIDEVEFGKQGAQWLVDKLGGKGNIIVLNGIEGVAVDAMRSEGAMSVFTKYPDIVILDEIHAGWDYAQAKTAMESFLSKHTQINGVWSQGGAMTQAALDAFIAAKRPLVPMSGEANNGLLKAWKENLENGFDSIAPCSPTSMSVDALNTAIKALDGVFIQLNTVITLPVITSDPLEDYVEMDLPDDFWNYTTLTSGQIEALYN